jgi:Na+-translocating ferredoxin:NAD+ oxidoreductase RnfD subunit
VDRDPRPLQLAVLALLLGFGAVTRSFVPTPAAIPAAFAGGLGTAAVASYWTGRPSSLLSAAISSLSVLLLFRSTHAWTYAVVAAAAIASKHLIRIDGRHFVNPTNGAILAGCAVLPGWVASGQWGHSVLLAFVLVAGASLTLSRAARLDTAGSFLGGLLVCLTLRNLAFGYPWATLGHAFQSGTLWLFALYMITDPKTTPQRAGARAVHGVTVAVLTVVLQQYFYQRDAFLWALLLAAPVVPLLDGLLVVPEPPSSAPTSSAPTSTAPTSSAPRPAGGRGADRGRSLQPTPGSV